MPPRAPRASSATPIARRAAVTIPDHSRTRVPAPLPSARGSRPRKPPRLGSPPPPGGELSCLQMAAPSTATQPPGHSPQMPVTTAPCPRRRCRRPRHRPASSPSSEPPRFRRYLVPKTTLRGGFAIPDSRRRRPVTRQCPHRLRGRRFIPRTKLRTLSSGFETAASDTRQTYYAVPSVATAWEWQSVWVQCNSEGTKTTCWARRMACHLRVTRTSAPTWQSTMFSGARATPGRGIRRRSSRRRHSPRTPASRRSPSSSLTPLSTQRRVPPDGS